jgi:G3E family GTPase
VNQIAFGDIILLNKIDLVGAEELQVRREGPRASHGKAPPLPADRSQSLGCLNIYLTDPTPLCSVP